MRQLFALSALCATAVVAVLFVVVLLRAARDVSLGADGDRPAEQRVPEVQRARDRAAGVHYRLDGRTVTVTARRRVAALEAVRGRTVVAQCAFLTVDGAALAQGRARWPRASRRLQVQLDSRPGRYAQFCELAPSASQPAVSRAVFATPRPSPAAAPR